MDTKQIIPYTCMQVDKCDFSSWYSNDTLRLRSIRSILLPLPSSFVEFLQSDSMVLPADLEIHPFPEFEKCIKVLCCVSRFLYIYIYTKTLLFS